MEKHGEKRSTFSGKLGFVLSAAGASVGLGNIWRFPYLAAKYGGGIFLLVYIILALTFGYTMIVAETTIGRMTKKSPVGAYQSFGKAGWMKFGGWIDPSSLDTTLISFDASQSEEASVLLSELLSDDVSLLLFPHPAIIPVTMAHTPATAITFFNFIFSILLLFCVFVFFTSHLESYRCYVKSEIQEMLNTSKR